ncbi:LamG-like jellyroll fold domain-containing protein [Planctomycetota bacterium]
MNFENIKIQILGLIVLAVVLGVFCSQSLADNDWIHETPSRLGEGLVTSMAVSPDGTMLAAWHDADGDWQTDEGELCLWDIQTQGRLGVLKDGLIWTNAIAFRPDGTLMALGCDDKTIRLIDVAGQNQVGILQASLKGGVESVVFSPDGNTLASSSGREKTIRLWNVLSQEQIGTLQGHTGAGVNCVAFSPDGNLLFSGGWRKDEAIRIWDVQSQKQVGRLIGHLDITYDLASSPDGTILASAGGWDDRAVYLWDIQTQSQVAVLGGHSAHVGSIAFSPYGTLLASTAYWNDTVYIWDTQTHTQIGTLTGHDASDLGLSAPIKFSSDGKWLACGSANGIELWQVNLFGNAPRTSVFGPKPNNGAMHDDTWAELSWHAGIHAQSHDVYVGDDFNDVNEGIIEAYRGNQTDTVYVVGSPGYPYPEGLARGTTYYWRVDEVNDTEPNSPWKGPVWSFTIKSYLLAHWKLDETEGDVAYNSVGDCDATLNGNPLWQPEGGLINGALQFDGTYDYLTTPFVINPAATAFSVFAWVQGGALGQVIVSQLNGANWLLADPAHGYLLTDIRAESGRNLEALVSETVITDGDWHRVGLVWDGTHRFLYADDRVVAADTGAIGLPSVQGGLNIGCDKNNTPNTFWSGMMDDVRIYDRVIVP